MLEFENQELCRHRWLALCVGYRGEPFVRSGNGVLIVPVNEAGEVLFVVEPAIPDARPVLGFPAGAVDPGEEPAESANRELQEEIGYKSSRLDLLHELHPLSRHAEWRVSVFLARELTPSRLVGDEPYEIPVERVLLNEFEQRIKSGDLRDSSVIAGLYMARSHIESELDDTSVRDHCSSTVCCT